LAPSIGIDTLEDTDLGEFLGLEPVSLVTIIIRNRLRWFGTLDVWNIKMMLEIHQNKFLRKFPQNFSEWKSTGKSPKISQNGNLREIH